VQAVAMTAASHDLIRWIKAALFREGKAVSGVVTPSCQSLAIPGRRRVSIWRRRQCSALNMPHPWTSWLTQHLPEQIRPWAEGRRQSVRQFLTCVSNHAGETGLPLENRPLHPAKLSSSSDNLDAGHSLLPHLTAAPVQIARPPAPRPALFSP